MLRQNDELAAQNRLLTEAVRQLLERIARLEKNSDNSSKPPSSDITNPQPPNKKKKKRKKGGQKGHFKQARPLFKAKDIDKTVVHQLPADEIQPRGLVPLEQTESTLQQINLPKKLYTVTDHRVQLYRAPNGSIVKATLPKAIRKAGLFSNQMTALTGYLKARGHMSYLTLQAFFSDIICDYFSANKKFIQLCKAFVQYCWAHLIRDIKFLITLGHKALQRWAESLLSIIRKIFGLWKPRHQRHRGRYKTAIEKLKNAFLKKVCRPPDHNEAMNIKKRFINNGDQSYFLLLEHEGVSPTNNLSEQAIRFVVIDRRITQGTRSWAGMRWCERAWTVIATCARHKQSVYQFFLKTLHATHTNSPYPKLIPE